MAKGNLVADGPYVLSSEEMATLRPRIPESKRDGQPLQPKREGLQEPSLKVDSGRAANDTSDLDAHIASFRMRLGTITQEKTQQLEAVYRPHGIRHICTIANSKWHCLEEEYCGHGLVERSMRWIPKSLERFEPRIRAEMNYYVAKEVFSIEAGQDRSVMLKEMKRNRYAKLKKATLATIGRVEEDWNQSPNAMVDAFMLETPTLGRWPEHDFVKESLQAQRIAFAGLVFAVDVCQGETRLMML